MSAKIESKMIELAGSIQKSLSDSLKLTMEELLKNNTEGQEDSAWSRATNAGERRHNSNYSCGTRLSRMEFPRFNGDNVKQWIYQCETYYVTDNTLEEFKVKLVVIHFEGRALQWYHAFVKSLWTSSWPSWGEYVQMLIERFGEVCDDPMVELMNLRQKGHVADYHEEFDAIITRLELFEEYTLSCFLGGLKQDVQMMVRMFPPQLVRKAFALAKLYESANNHNPLTQFPAKASKPPLLPKPLNSAKPVLPSEPVLFHKKLQLHVIEVEDQSEDEEEIKELQPETKDYGQPQISVNALTGMVSFRTMRVTGHYLKKPLHILIDSGSTHNFLDIQRAKTIGCKIEELDPLMVTVADDFKAHGMRHVLRGSSTGGKKTIKNQQLERIWSEGIHLSMLQVCNIEGGLFQSITTHAEQPPLPREIAQVLDRFAKFFEEPTHLPPMRVGHNHQIPLLQGSNPVNKRPYRYAKHQKDIIDKLVQDMLSSGIIQNSCSSYASPVVLVGKKDCSWRLCVDYRELNKGTVKDRFPLPLIEDLMDQQFSLNWIFELATIK
ncbi:PREDICTED: uncharacterized protein LOC109333995 [Lupinus angustifolius]|uniref:uncharacterized protein LOC109333995 n=1 Tax=Lupinus angustifolius TaxID=3871 RepID=UPI00092EB25A|nr:PREDICTED: uncharacterized protein LOC109333995 [Lupinus angustifolius]